VYEVNIVNNNKKIISISFLIVTITVARGGETS